MENHTLHIPALVSSFPPLCSTNSFKSLSAVNGICTETSVKLSSAICYLWSDFTRYYTAQDTIKQLTRRVVPDEIDHEPPWRGWGEIVNTSLSSLSNPDPFYDQNFPLPLPWLLKKDKKEKFMGSRLFYFRQQSLMDIEIVVVGRKVQRN